MPRRVAIGRFNRIAVRRYDPDALDWIQAVEAADGQRLESSVRLAMNEFVKGSKSDPSPNPGVSNWTAMKTGCLMAGPRTLAGALVPFKGVAPTNVNLTAAEYFRSIGLVGTASGYINSNRLTDADPQDNQSMGVWITNPGGSGTFGLIGANATSDTGATRIGETSTAMVYRSRSATSNQPAGIQLNTGLIGISRNDSLTYMAAEGNGSVVSRAVTSTALTSSTIFVTRINGGFGGPNLTRRYSFYWIGEAVDLQKLNARVQTYMNAVSTTLEAETQTWVDNIAANGGSVSSSFTQAVNTFVINTMIDGTWPLMTDIGILAGVDNLNAALVKLKGATTTLVNNNFVNGDYVATGATAGLKGDGATRYLLPTLNRTVSGLMSCSVYVNTPQTPSGSTNFWLATAAFSSGLGYTNTGTTDAFNDSGTAASSAQVVTSPRNGYYIGSSRSTTDRELYRNGASIATDTGLATAGTVVPFAIFASGSPSSFSAARISFYHISPSTSLSTAQAQAISTRVNTLMTSIGANVY